MTTIILTIIGILLAALAALMIIFYGGSAFNAGSTKAQANTLQNAGTNVISAADLALANGDTAATASVAALSTGGYLKAAPSLPGTLTGDVDASGKYYEVASVPADVCAAVNSNLKVTAGAVGDSKMGCSTDSTFYATL